MSASWFVVTAQTLIGARDFVSSTTPDYQLAHVPEMCRCLAALQSISNLFLHNKDPTKIELAIACYCLGVIRKLEKKTIVVSMNTKLHPIVREL